MEKIDYSKIDQKMKSAIRTIDEKPHVKYIRYLLSKRYSPSAIKQELFRLGLSAPHEPNLTAYYICVMDPIIRKNGLGSLYGEYKNKILRKNVRGQFSKEILNYSLDLKGDLDGQVNFCKFTVEAEIDSLWSAEILRCHGTVDALPVDETGTRIISYANSVKSIERILTHPKRYLVDKMILENVQDSRITAYCRENLKLLLQDYDVRFYRKTFFNIKTHTIEDKIKLLEVEKKSLENLLSDLENLSLGEEMDIGEKALIRRQSQQRIEELVDNIKTLNMLFSEFAFKTAVSESNDFEQMFTDIVARGYKRFCSLDTYKDRDVVDPMFKVARIMTFAHDKVENIKSSGNSLTADKHSQAVLMELYKKRTDDILKDEVHRANRELELSGIEPMTESLLPDDIAGIEDLGVSFDIKED